MPINFTQEFCISNPAIQIDRFPENFQMRQMRLEALLLMAEILHQFIW